jgi:hypothetical protein
MALLAARARHLQMHREPGAHRDGGERIDAETANTKGVTRVTPFAVCFGAPAWITLKHRV